MSAAPTRCPFKLGGRRCARPVGHTGSCLHPAGPERTPATSYDQWVRRARPTLARRLFHKEWDLCTTDEKAVVQAAADRMYPLMALAAEYAIELAELVTAVEAA